MARRAREVGAQQVVAQAQVTMAQDAEARAHQMLVGAQVAAARASSQSVAPLPPPYQTGSVSLVPQGQVAAGGIPAATVAQAAHAAATLMSSNQAMPPPPPRAPAGQWQGPGSSRRSSRDGAGSTLHPPPVGAVAFNKAGTALVQETSYSSLPPPQASDTPAAYSREWGGGLSQGQQGRRLDMDVHSEAPSSDMPLMGSVPQQARQQGAAEAR